MVFPGPKDIQREIKNFNNEQIEFVNPSEEITIMGGFRESELEMWPEYTEYDKKILTPLLLS